MSQEELFHLWIVGAGLLAAWSCAVLGVFLVLRRMSLLGDAISHSILPGIAGAYLLTGTRDVLPMFLGATCIGLFTAYLSQFLSKHCHVDRGAALGVVFTTLFALGVVMIRYAADSVDLDPGCVLYGLLELTPLDTMNIFNVELPRAVVLLGTVFIINIIFVSLFYKELMVSSFDPAFAAAIGIAVNVVHYLLMSSVAITSVAAFESVGSILVVAMFIVPGAVARLWSDRLSHSIVIAIGVATLSTLVGYRLALSYNTSVAGMMATAAGAIFLLSAFLAPRYGLLGKLVHFVILRIRILSEDMLGLAYRCREGNYRQAFPLSSGNLVSAVGGGILSRLALESLIFRNDLTKSNSGVYEMTPQGQERAQLLVRTHRLWEDYLVRFLKLKRDHVHDTATKLEHFTNTEMERMLTERLDSPTYDPHGKAIPPVKFTDAKKTDVKKEE